VKEGCASCGGSVVDSISPDICQSCSLEDNYYGVESVLLHNQKKEEPKLDSVLIPYEPSMDKKYIVPCPECKNRDWKFAIIDFSTEIICSKCGHVA